jgi:hypothetical protein
VALVALPAALAATPPGDDVTVKSVTTLPPVDKGDAQLTIAEAVPAVAVTAVGAPGGPIGVTLLEGADDSPVPDALVAVTVNVYDVPLLRPLTVQGDPGQGRLPPDQITVYPVMALPLGFGAAHLTIAVALPAVAVTAAGAPGGPIGVTLLEGADDGPAPDALVAVTVNVYDVPLLSPLTMQGDPMQGRLPPDQITVYPVMALPLGFGAVQLTVAWLLPAVAVTPVGAPGAPGAVGVTALDGADAGLDPYEFVAVTVNV